MRRKQTDALEPFVIATFSTALNWMGLLGQNSELVSVFVGHSSQKSIHAKVCKGTSDFRDDDWNPDLRLLFQAYAEGELIDFDNINVRLPVMTPFRQKVTDATRRLAYGQTTSYGDLARMAGHPRAARAVGTVMSTNRFPILIPCHRVLAAGGKLGGYTSPLGTGFKERLLELEARTVGCRPDQASV